MNAVTDTTSDKLPRPTVTVHHSKPETDSQTGSPIGSTERIEVSIGREAGKHRIYIGEGHSTNEAVGKAVENIISDPYSAEWLPEPKTKDA